ncbi:hypothetical protein [Geothrix edaphica]|uniref:Glycine zipper 2TM domain-containing protein n=1 Tax=Geothrix edaphica TaxID=2927976 RepID=A0ABQ5PU21_9BACT|nr:hypothetical protein [Geothrix edaphica]GLH65867.1 hypothetical protein GETHED_02310 [Geothrix edaphica]
MNDFKRFAPGALTVLVAVGFTACQPKASDATVQAQVAAQLQAKAAEDRVAMLEQQVADMKAGKNRASGDQEAINQVSLAHMRALDRQLADARQRAAERRKDAATLASTPVAQLPRVTIVEVPSGTRITVRMGAELATDRDQAGDPWSGTLSEDVMVGNTVVWPAGTNVSGVVAQSTPAGRLSSGNGGLGIRLTTVGHNGVDAGTYMVVGDTRGKRDAKFIGGTAALGALVGVLTDKNHQGDHALGGAAAGALAGTALAAGTADTVIRIPSSQLVTFSLTAPEPVSVK